MFFWYQNWIKTTGCVVISPWKMWIKSYQKGLKATSYADLTIRNRDVSPRKIVLFDLLQGYNHQWYVFNIIQQYDTVLSRSDGSVHPIYCELLWCWDPTFLGVLVGLVQTNPALHKPRGNLQSPRLQKQLAKWASLIAHPMVQILIKTDQPTPGYRREIRTLPTVLKGIRGYPHSFYEPIPFNLIQRYTKHIETIYGFLWFSWPFETTTKRCAAPRCSGKPGLATVFRGSGQLTLLLPKLKSKMVT